MKAAVLYAPQEELRIEDVDVDGARGHEVLVRIAACGVCGSDLHSYERGYVRMPVILGHEASGVVEEVGPLVTQVKQGDHVILYWLPFCGTCRMCLIGEPTHCLNGGLNGSMFTRQENDPPVVSRDGTVIYQSGNGIGGFAQYTTIHENMTVKIPDDFPLEIAALVGCGVTTGLGAILNTAKVRPGSTVAVWGCGGVGLSAVQGAKLAGATRIIAVDIYADKEAMAKKMGATDFIDASKTSDVPEVLKEMTHGIGLDYGVDAIATKTTTETGFASLREGGTMVVVGIMPPGTIVEIPSGSLIRDRHLVGSFMGCGQFRSDIPLYLEYYKQGRLKLDELVTRKAPLEEATEALENIRTGKAIRTLLVPN